MILSKKYVLEYFLEKISELTPYSNQGKKNFYVTQQFDQSRGFNKEQVYNDSKLVSDKRRDY